MEEETNFSVIVREANEDEWEQAMAVAWRTFMKFEANEYSPEGVKQFYDFISDNSLKKMFQIKEYYVLVALVNEEIVGVISVRSRNHISLLFVEAKYHHKGIATMLMNAMWEYLRQKNETECTVHSSPYAVGFYHKLGFRNLDIEQESDGIRYTPMKVILR